MSGPMEKGRPPDMVFGGAMAVAASGVAAACAIEARVSRPIRTYVPA